MGIIATDTSTRYDPPPEDTYPAVCVDVVDLGEIESQYAGETRLRHVVKLIWQIDYLREDGLRYELSRRFTLSLHEKAALRGFLERWRGKRFTAEELKGFDLERILGVNGQLQVLHNTSIDGKVWANVETVTPIIRGQEKLAPTNYIRAQDRVEAPDKDNPSDAPEF